MVGITKLFLSNRSQAVRIPADLRLPDTVKEVEVRACGLERIIAPVGRSWNMEKLAPIGVAFPLARALAHQENCATPSAVPLFI